MATSGVTARRTPAAEHPGHPGPVGTTAVAWLPVLVVALLVAAVQVVYAVRHRAWYDEDLMVAIGRYHLDWGAADEPPLTPVLAKLADAVAPDSPLAVSGPAILATAAAVVLAALVARELGGNGAAQSLAAVAQATGVWVAEAGHWLTPYTLEPMLWLAVVWLVVRWIRLRDDRLLLVLGVVVGVGAETKFQVIVLAVLLLATLALAGPREILRRRRLWVGAGIALLVAAPTLWWQQVHGWPQLRLASDVAAQTSADMGRSGVAELLVTNAGALGIALGAVGLAALLVAPRWRAYRFLGITVVVYAVLVVVPPGRGYYLAGAYGALAAVGAVTVQQLLARHGRARRWPTWVAVGVLAALTVASLAADRTALRTSTKVASPVVADAVVAATARAYAALPVPQRARTAVLTDTHMYASYLDSSPRALGLPPAASGNVSYGYMPPPPESRDAALFVGAEPVADSVLAVLRPFFTVVRPVARLDPAPDSHGLVGGGTDTTIWLLSGRRLPWATIWPALR